ncbi:MAG: hypothetical protein ACP5OM_02495 [Methanothrix sp.]
MAEEIQERGEKMNPLDVLKCRHKDRMRPFMEGCGENVFKTIGECHLQPPCDQILQREDCTLLHGAAGLILSQEFTIQYSERR